MILTFLRSNSGLIFAMYPSSVVQTGVKSFGWENSTAHDSPIQSWKLILPRVVSASKSGAVWLGTRPTVGAPFVGTTWIFSPALTSIAVRHQRDRRQPIPAGQLPGLADDRRPL